MMLVTCAYRPPSCDAMLPQGLSAATTSTGEPPGHDAAAASVGPAGAVSAVPEVVAVVAHPAASAASAATERPPTAARHRRDAARRGPTPVPVIRLMALLGTPVRSWHSIRDRS